jgi:hypothetical protein
MTSHWKRPVATGSKVVLLLVVLGGAISCRDEIAMPAPAPQRNYRESDDWIKPGRNIRLKAGVGPGRNTDTFVVFNAEAFALNLLDDVWLSVHAPNAEVRPDGPYIGDGRHGWTVYLRCPAPRTIPANSRVEISFDSCRITTYEPGRGARLAGYHLAAREGYADSHVEGGGQVVRKAK